MLLLLPVVVAAFGAVGVWLGWQIAVIMAPIPIAVLLARSGATTIVEAVVVALTLGFLIAILIPSTKVGVSSARRDRCADNLRQIMAALHKYHDVYGSFPPANVADADGQPMHSWRALILPFLGEQGLAGQYDFSQPWDGPGNSALLPAIPLHLFCPSDTARMPSMTSYLLITGEGTGWPGDHAPCLNDFGDAPSQTIVLVEVVNSGIHWLEPRDLSLKEAVRGINANVGLCISSSHEGGAHSGRLDGSVRFVPDSLNTGQLRAMITSNGGEIVVEPD